MLHFKVNNKDYKAFEKWDEMPLNKAVELHTLCKLSMPENLKRFFEISLLTDESFRIEVEKYCNDLTEEEKIKINPKFYGEVLKCLSNIDDFELEQLQPAYREMFYKNYLEKFVFGVINYPFDYKIQNIKSFLFDGVEYFLPETKNVLGTEKPFFDRTAIEFTEAADLELYSNQLSGGKYEMAANIISILCRPNEEKYNEAICLNRAEKFKQLTMDKVFEVFFCFNEHINLSKQHTQLYIQEQQIKLIKQLEVAE